VWTRCKAFAQMKLGSNIQLLPYPLVSRVRKYHQGKRIAPSSGCGIASRWVIEEAAQDLWLALARRR
jgi:hypothetical protein